MKKLLLLIPLVVFIMSCGGDGAGTSFFPLGVGYIWEYIITMTITTPDTTLSMTGTEEEEITAETTLDNGTEVFEQITTMTQIIPFDTLFVDTIVEVDTAYVEETEDYILLYDSKDDTEPDTMVALPLESGKTWHYDSTTTATVVGQENVTVPAGTFSNCWKIAIVPEDGPDTIWAYAAENVGQVKVNWSETNVDTTFEWELELEDYDVD
jgi:hypothetical protein